MSALADTRNKSEYTTNANRTRRISIKTYREELTTNNTSVASRIGYNIQPLTRCTPR